MNMRRFLALLGAALMLLLAPPPSAAVTGTTLLAQHPSVLAQPTSGRPIRDLALVGTRLYLGHGDYSANTGPIGLAWVDTTTGATGVDITAPTEEINTLRTFGGGLYAPWVDPTICGYCHPKGSGGYTTSVGGWHHTNAFPAAHVFDIARYGTDLFLSGAGAYDVDGAVIYRSTDNGATWKLSLAQASKGGITGWERFYWMGQAGGKLYAQAAHTDGPNAAVFPMQVWDGKRWAKVRNASLGYTIRGSDVESFKGLIYGTNGRMTDGRKAIVAGPPFFVQDYYVAGTLLYAVEGNGKVARTTGTTLLATVPTWTVLPGTALPAGQYAASLAVAGGRVFVGTYSGRVYVSTL